MGGGQSSPRAPSGHHRSGPNTMAPGGDCSERLTSRSVDLSGNEAEVVKTGGRIMEDLLNIMFEFSVVFSHFSSSIFRLAT